MRDDDIKDLYALGAFVVILMAAAMSMLKILN